MGKIKYVTNNINKFIKKDLNEFSKITNVKKVIALHDIHLKRGEMSPTGSILLSNKEIIPSFTHLTVGSGISAWIIKGLNKDNMVNISRTFSNLKKNVPGKSEVKRLKYLPKFINDNFLKNCLISGAKTLYNKNLLTKNDLKNIENKGNFLRKINFKKKEIIDALPPNLLKRCFSDFGALGTGNTFIELHKIKKILNKRIADNWKVGEKDYILFVHSGCGQAYLNLYFTPRWGLRDKQFLEFEKEKWIYHYKSLTDKSSISIKKNFFPNSSKFFSINFNSKQGKIYYLAINALTNLSLVNRLWLGYYTLETLQKNSKTKIEKNLLWDSVHDSIQIYDKKKNIIHRHGATFVNNNNLKSPIIFPGAPGEQIDILKPEKNIKYLLNSFCHGVGRKIDRPLARKKFNHNKTIQEITQNGIKLYYSKTNFSGEHPKSFKNKKSILKQVIKNKFCSNVLSTQPLSILKS